MNVLCYFFLNWTVLLFSLVKCSAVQIPILNNGEYPGRAELLQLHKNLVDIESVTGNELGVQQYLQEYLQERDFTVEALQLSPGRSDIYAYLGKTRNTKILLTSHYDTVPPFFPYSDKGERIYGRGSCDAKASIASQVIAVQQLRASGNISEGDIGLLYVVDEEVYGQGMKKARESLGVDSWSTVIFGEPTENKLAIGHKGIGIATFHAEGISSHSGYPELGRSAVEILLTALNKLMAVELPKSELLGESTLNIGKISGGVAANVIPAHAEATVSIRIAADPEKVEQILLDVAEASEYITLHDFYIVSPQYLDYQVAGFDTIICKYSTDIPNLPGNFTRYLYGPGSILQAHSENDEWVTKTSLFESVDDYKTLALHALSG